MKSNILHWLVLTGVPFENSGGAQRAAQISKTLLNKGHKVTYVYAIDYEEKNQIKVDTPIHNFKTCHISKFSIYKFVKQLKIINDLIILIEVPHPSFLTVIKNLKRYSQKVIYELIDPWDTELGQNWYDKNIEYEIIKLADILTATAINLQQKLEQKTSRTVHLIPNAYNDNLFNAHNKYEKPKDLPSRPILGYIGALWGSWFDIDLILQIAKKYPNYNIVLIGEYVNQFDNISPSNVYFLGLKAQSELPAYLSYFNVGLIPFKVNKLTDGVNPLKVYEYLAMEIPVVSTNMTELKHMPNVYLANDNKDFIKKIDIVINNEVEFNKIEDWLEQHTWRTRINKLLELIF